MADKTEIMNEIEALSVHCRPPMMEASLRTSWLRDWCADLGNFPIEAVRLGCREWRHSGATKFPSPGQLIALIKAKQPAPDVERINEWQPLSDQDYQALSLRDKIRHQLILAADAARKAGPMWRNGGTASISRPVSGHVAAEDMPDAWRRWRRIAEEHAAEAKRLRAYLRQRPEAA